MKNKANGCCHIDPRSKVSKIGTSQILRFLDVTTSVFKNPNMTPDSKNENLNNPSHRVAMEGSIKRIGLSTRITSQNSYFQHMFHSKVERRTTIPHIPYRPTSRI